MRLVPIDPRVVHLARDAAAPDQTVEVRHALAGGHLQQHRVGYGPAEEDAEHIARALRLTERIEQPAQRFLVSIDELIDPAM
jgi:hypothetical protein